MVYDEIKNQFKKVVAYSQGIPEPMVDELFNDWLNAKRDFIEAFGGKLIYEWPSTVSFELDPKEKKLRVDDFISLVSDRYDNYDLSSFIEVNREGFFSNQVVQEYEYKGNKISKGMKLLRAFKFFEDDENVLGQIQNSASMIIQEDKIEGKLCLSVHPLDFLSTSENNHNWRSCHALDGEYRAGNLSHMIDSSTVICYLKSNRPEILSNFPEDVPWNSKKWRALFYFSERWDMVFAGRQYPFGTKTGLDFAKNNLFPVANLGNFTSWKDKKIKSWEDGEIQMFFHDSYLPMADGIKALKELVINEPGSLQFNDVLSSSCYNPVYAFKEIESLIPFRPMYTARMNTKFRIGGEVKCLRCNNHPIQITESFMCNSCELEYGESDDDMFSYCPNCGSRFFYDDGVYVEDSDECVCPRCAENETKICDCCGIRYYKEDLMYDRETEKDICKHCYEEMYEEV